MLSFEQAPPAAVPLRFFLTAPVFLGLAGATMALSADELFATRWSPAALAATHLLTTGFMLQVMLGALFQLMPVAAGANLPQPARLAVAVHVGCTVGALLLSAGFLFGEARWLGAGGALLGGTLGVFAFAAGWALWRTPARGATVVALRLAIAWLAATVVLGVLMALARGGWLGAAVLGLSPVHVAVGLAGWGGLLVAGTAYLVVPMFQLTPAYPAWFSRRYAWALSAALLLGAALQGRGWWLPVLLLVAGFCLMTLDRQRRRHRAKVDVTFHLWRLALISALVAMGLMALAVSMGGLPAVSVLAGVLVLLGAYVSLIVGMLYKIVPFILWIHLQPRVANVPAMTRMLNARWVRWQWRLHAVALILGVLAPFVPILGYAAGIAVLIATGLLEAVLIRVARHARLAEAAGAQPS